MTAQNTTGRGIVDLDARVVEAVARSLGVDYQPEPDLLAAALPVVMAVPGGEARKRDGAAFAPVVAVPAQAGPLDQIVAALGRSPSWPR